jgi:uncharacterized protein DUF5916/cellulose/xylan binding protein with CBM9 domain
VNRRLSNVVGSHVLHLTLVWACVPAPARAQVDLAAIRKGKVIRAVPTTEPILIDGRMDDPVWVEAPVAHDFIQQEPAEGSLATEPSEFRVVYDEDALYIFGTFYDSDPRGGIVNELKRDFASRDGDAVAVIISPFRDGNSSNFQVNPAGALRDSQNYEDGRQTNANWDAVWWAKTAKFDGGWTMEMKVPFRSLRFPTAEEQVWGINVFRLIRRKNESAYWSPQARQFSTYKPSSGGRLVGLRGIRPGHNLYVKPFATAAVSNASIPSLNRRWDADAGADLKYGVGSSLALDLTFRTDFSQVEVDEQQINLTRFSLFFPEKREFFLENQGAFRIGDLDSSGQTTTVTRRDLLPFFSRRIGLSPSGAPVPIWGGARLTGRQGAYTVGLLNMQTEAFDGRPSENFTTAHIVRNFGASAIGGFYTGREGSHTTGSNRVAGGDVHLNFRRAIDVNALAMSSDTNGKKGSAARGALALSGTWYAAQASYTSITPDFRGDLGFFPRGDIGLTAWDASRIFRPRPGSRIRSHEYGSSGEIFEDSGHDALQSRHLRTYTRQNVSDGGVFEADVDWNYERLTAPFEVSTGVIIPPGEYRFRQFLSTFSSNKSNRLSGSGGYTGGEFYSGDIRGWTGGVRLRVDEHVAASANYAYNDVWLPQGAFTTHLPRFRVDWSFSTRMFLNAFVQYNSATSTWLTNVRYRLIYRPLSDFYFVYNELSTSGRPARRTIALKHTILLSF